MGNRAPQDKTWELDGDPFFVNDDEALSQALMESVTILTRIGGGVTIAPYRQELAPGVWHTTGYLFKWSSFMPGVRYQEQPAETEQDDLEPASDPVPVEATA